jgi:hypothetical protein
MISVLELDEQLKAITPWIVKAGVALKGFYRADQGAFWHDTIGFVSTDADVRQKRHPTSINRSFFALYEYLRFLTEENYLKGRDMVEKDVEVRFTGDSARELPSAISILQGVAGVHLSLLPTERGKELVRESPDNGVNMFTDSHLLLATSLLENDRAIQGSKLSADLLKDIRNVVDKVFTENRDILFRCSGGIVHEKDDEVHDFVTLSVLRGFDAHSKDWSDVRANPTISAELTKLEERIKLDVLKHLGYYSAGLASNFDPTELAFSIACLSRFSTPDAPQLIQRAVEIILESQSRDGGWPTARYVSYKGRALLHVASYEVALTLTHILIRSLYADEITNTSEMLFTAIQRAFGQIQSNYAVETVISPIPAGANPSVQYLSGWSNDHARHKGLIESWATAVVLTFLTHYRDALQLLRQNIVSRSYLPSYPENPVVFSQWPDLTAAFKKQPWIDNTKIDEIADPMTTRKPASLPDLLKKHVVTPVAESWIMRPTTTSIILYGDPGSGKTTIASKIAEALRWPFIILSPPNFLNNGGIDGFEAAADRIFDDLMRLRRVVVLFDESEGFFKRRQQTEELESRTTGAFITSGMLPRLQALHDKQWIIYVLATNSELSALDPAVTRPGRFDLQLEINNLTLAAQTVYVKKLLLGAKQERTAFVKQLLDTGHTEPEATKVAKRVYSQLETTIVQALNLYGEKTDAHPVSFKLLNKLVSSVLERGILQTGNGQNSNGLSADEVLEMIQQLQ